MNPATVLRVLACSLLLAAPAPGADPDLDRIEREYLAQRDVIVRPLLSGFAQKLRSLHASLSQRSDPRAAAVKSELDRTVLRLSLPAGSDLTGVTETRPPASDPAAGRPVELRGPKAALAGGALYNEKGVAAVQFKGRGATAVWNLPTLKPGRYRVQLDCGCAAGLGALAQVAFGDQPPRTLTVLPTSESGQAASFNFGEVQLPAGATTLKVGMIDVPPRTKGSGGFTLHLITITPVEGARPGS